MNDFIHMPIPASMFTAVCALLGGVSVIPAVAAPKSDAAKPATAPASELSDNSAATEQAGNGSTATTGASLYDGAVDAAGWPWDAAMHASTRTMTKEGLWRMKVGVSRPDAKPGFPKETGGTGTKESSPEALAGATAAIPAAGEDEDEFAAFRAAADKAGATDTAAVASIPARKWTDADLGALCNQAAVKLGDPAPVKAIIAEFAPAGEVPHSRLIPDDKRDAFARAVEAKAGITFAG